MKESWIGEVEGQISEADHDGLYGNHKRSSHNPDDALIFASRYLMACRRYLIARYLRLDEEALDDYVWITPYHVHIVLRSEV